MTIGQFTKHGVFAAALSMVLAFGSSAAQAQNGTNTFRPSERTHDGFAISTASDQGHLNFGAQIYLDYADDPQERQVDDALTGHLVLSLGLGDRFIVYAGMPYHFILNAKPTGDDDGIGDVYVGSRIRLMGTEEDFWQLAVQGTLEIGVAAMQADRNTLRGMPDRSPQLGGHPELVSTFNLGGGKFRLSIMAGYDMQQKMRKSGRGEELTYGAGLIAGVIEGDSGLDIIAEVNGGTPLNVGDGPTAFGKQDFTSLEALGGFKYHHRKGFSVGAGGGAGVLVKAINNPDWRVFAMLGYTMLDERKPKVNDKDKDGIADEMDRCVDQAEDKDGFEDEDGCPEADNDNDGVADSADQCPNEAEDADGYQDTDGCPDADNDGDGVADLDDRCPMDAGSADNRGCPVVDRDGDGINDNVDNCPDEPGTVENYGCVKKQLVEIKQDKIVIMDKVFYATGSAKILKRSHPLLNNVADVLKAHPEIKKIQVEGHTDSRGSDEMNLTLSQKRAESVVSYLVTKGVESERLTAVGYGETKPVEPDAKSAEDLAANRRVEFNIVE